MEIITKYNYEPQGGEIVTGLSLTVPDQTISLKTLVTKYVRGMPISVPVHQGIYTDDEIASDFRKLDLSDQDEITQKAFDEVAEFKNRIHKSEEEAKLHRQKQLEELKEQLRKKEEELKSIGINQS